ncbi:MAG: NfeD family protein [Verrucomicrobiales bacterium]|nr:NfeD family protein [Verrucomicrobiales bacterium]
MIRRLTPWTFIFLFLLSGVSRECVADGAVDGESSQSESGENWKGKTLVIPVADSDFSDSRLVRELDRMFRKADQDRPAAIIFEIQTSIVAPWDAQRRILTSVQGLDVPTIGYVKQSGIGSGAMLSLACDAIYLGPSAIVGAAGVSDEAEADEKAKSARMARDRSVMKAMARSLAKGHGHRPEVAEAMVDEAQEVNIGGELISAKGEILTLTADEAIRDFEGKPLFAKGVASDVAEVLKSEGLPAELVRISPREFGEAASRARVGEARSEKADSGEAESNENAAAESGALFGRREEGSYAGKVVVLKVGQDTLATGDASFEFMNRILKKSELDGAEAVIFDMDTPGGYAWHTVSLVLNGLQNVSFPTYTFVNSRAESAGAIIAMGTDHIYMKPAASIGSALVVSGAGQDLSESMNDKVTQMMIGTIRNVAELKGHNPDIGEAFVTREKEVEIDGVVIHKAGNVLNLNSIRATEEIGGKPVLAKGIALSLEQLVEREGLEGEIVRSVPLGMEAFAHWVQKLSFLLIIIGLAGAYLEINSPGFGVPGLVSICVLTLFFFGNYLAGNLAGYELAVLLVLGLILIGIEVFLFPGAILPGAIGVGLVVVSLGLAMVDRVDLEWKWEGMPDAKTWGALLGSAFWTLIVGMAGALIVALLGMRFLPDTKLGSRLVLKESVAQGASIATSREVPASADYLGLNGETTTDLVPSGKGIFDGKLLDVVSDGEFIKRGEAVIVLRHEGSRIVVGRA